MSLQSGDILRHCESKRMVLLQEEEKTPHSHKKWCVLWLDTGATDWVFSLVFYNGEWRKVA